MSVLASCVQTIEKKLNDLHAFLSTDHASPHETNSHRRDHSFDLRLQTIESKLDCIKTDVEHIIDLTNTTTAATTSEISDDSTVTPSVGPEKTFFRVNRDKGPPNLTDSADSTSPETANQPSS